MKLEQRTIQILKNFSTINPSLLFKPGSYLTTIAPERNIMAKAGVKENFPSQFAIYDVSRFLSVLSLFDEPDLNFKDKYVNISNGSKTLRYTFAAPEMVIAPPDKELKIVTPEIKFSLSADDLNQLQKAASVMQMPEIIIGAAEGSMFVSASDSKNQNGDCYNIELGKSKEDFNVIFRTANLRLLPGEYNIEISSSPGFGHFYNDEVHYWITVEQNSRFSK